MPEIYLQILYTFIFASILASFMLFFGMVAIYFERKIAGHIQSRPGPLHVGPHGIFQSLADGIKLIYKENLTPKGADKPLFYLAPVLVFVIALLSFSIIPFDRNLIAIDPNIGIFFIIAVTGLNIVSILMAGYASNNKYSFMGSIRSAAQAISYEIPMIFSVLSIVVLAQSLKLSDIIDAQDTFYFILFQPISFLIFLISGLVETNRTPFDLPEAESELVAGYHTEYSGIKFSLFMLAEYCGIFVVSALAATLFLGGPSGPFLPGICWFFIKTLSLVFFIMVFRWTFPRVRSDQMLSFCWKFLVPLSIANLVITSIVFYFL